MRDSPLSRRVLIVGGGIGGAVLGDRLAVLGREVVICERHREVPVLARPEILWPVTRERLLRCAGGREVVETSLLPLGGIEARVGERWLTLLRRESLERSPHRPYSAEPVRLRQQLLAASPCALHWGSAWTAPLLEGEGERGRVCGGVFQGSERGVVESMRAEWIVGDDGTHSRVRETAGVPLPVEAFPLDFLCFPAQWPAAIAPDVARLWIAPGLPGIAGAMVVPQPPGGVGAGVVLVDHEAQEPECLRRFWETSLERLPGFSDFVAHPGQLPVRVGREWGHAESYGGRGLLLLGDALHPTSPVGGQGTNMAVADAIALARLIGNSDGPSDTIRTSYERQRKAANRRAVGLTASVAACLKSRLPGGLTRGLLHTSLRMVSALGVAAPCLRYPATAFVGNETDL